MRRSPVSLRTLVVLMVVGAVVWRFSDASVWSITVAVLAGWLMLRVGFAMLRGLGTPLPPPPPPGELRKVRLTYQCSICGTEVRMTTANDEVPDPPRHCQEDMDLVSPIDG